MPKIATSNDLGGIGCEDEVWFVGGEGEGGVFGAVGGVGCCAVEALLAACGAEDDEVTDVERGGLRGGAELEDTSCAWTYFLILLFGVDGDHVLRWIW